MQLDYDFHVTPKKDSTSLNHLLNFTYAPLQQTHHVWTGKKRVAGGKWNQYNKEQFLQAKYSIIISLCDHDTVRALK